MYLDLNLEVIDKSPMLFAFLSFKPDLVDELSTEQIRDAAVLDRYTSEPWKALPEKAAIEMKAFLKDDEGVAQDYKYAANLCRLLLNGEISATDAFHKSKELPAEIQAIVAQAVAERTPTGYPVPRIWSNWADSTSEMTSIRRG